MHQKISNEPWQFVNSQKLPMNIGRLEVSKQIFHLRGITSVTRSKGFALMRLPQQSLEKGSSGFESIL